MNALNGRLDGITVLPEEHRTRLVVPRRLCWRHAGGWLARGCWGMGEGVSVSVCVLECM